MRKEWKDNKVEREWKHENANQKWKDGKMEK